MFDVTELFNSVDALYSFIYKVTDINALKKSFIELSAVSRLRPGVAISVLLCHVSSIIIAFSLFYKTIKQSSTSIPPTPYEETLLTLDQARVFPF